LKSSRARSDDARKNPLLLPPHGRLGASSSCGMIATQHVKRAVDHESKHFLSRWNPLSMGIFPRYLRADINVPDNRAALSSASEAERNHVRGTMVTQEAPVQLGDCSPPNESD
jgi:hypothetical protein